MEYFPSILTVRQSKEVMNGNNKCGLFILLRADMGDRSYMDR